MDGLHRKTSEVDIMITAPSSPSNHDTDSSELTDEEDDPLEDDIYEDDGDNTGSLSDHSSISENERPETEEKEECTKDEIMEEEEEEEEEEIEKELCSDFSNGVKVSEEKPSVEERENNGEQNNYEIVGDRVLVEKDGKFELVDANEIKAEYFEMLGIKSENTEASESESEKKSEVSCQDTELEQQSPVKERPKTTPSRTTRNQSSYQRANRVQSSWGARYRNSEYAKIRSPYGLSDKQLEMKRRREEAIARRKKEEEERAKEEEKRKREDAERAFQAWLSSKREEEKERRMQALKEQKGEDNTRATEAEKAYKAWKASKKKQQEEEKEEATRRMEETASMYVVHDREACDEAFRRWLKKKKEDKKTKEMEKKKKLRPRSRRKPKEPLPINSAKIRFTDNYGYRNTVVF